MAFRLAQISDTHLCAAKPYFVANFLRIADALARDRPDLVVNTGDISLDGASDEADLAEARKLHDALGLDFKCIPGNHDVGDNADVPRAFQRIDASCRDRYRKHFGDDWWCEDVPGWRLVGVNAQLIASGLDAAREQTRFVHDAAAGAGRRRIALFVHKPLFESSADEADVGGRFLNPEPRRELLAALAASPPALVACGHVHQFRETSASGAHHVWAPSTAYCIPDTYQPRYGVKEIGYVMHDLNEDGSHESRFVKAPGTEDLSIADFPDAYGLVR